MEKVIDLLKELGVIIGAVGSMYKTYKEIVKPYLDKRRKRKAMAKRLKNTKN